MKITFAVQNYFPAFGGSEELVKTLAESFVNDYGHSCRVLTSNAYSCDAFNNQNISRMDAGESVMNGVQIQRFDTDCNSSKFLNFIDRFIDADENLFRDFVRMYNIGPRSAKFLKAILNDDSDILILTSFPLLHIFYGYLAKTITGKKIVIHGNFHINDKNFDNRLCRIVAFAADGYVCNSAAEYDYFLNHGMQKSKMRIIPAPAVGLPEFRYGKEEARKLLNISSAPVFLYFGQIHSNKNLELLCRVFTSYNSDNRDAILCIAGSGHSGYHNELKKIINTFPEKISKNIIVETNISEERKSIIYSAADFFVMPSVFDSLGISMIEAWAYRIPVIVSGTKQLKSVFENNINAFVFAENSGTDLLDTLKKVSAIENVENVHNVVNSAFNTFLEKYDKNILINNYNKFLTEIVYG